MYKTRCECYSTILWFMSGYAGRFWAWCIAMFWNSVVHQGWPISQKNIILSNDFMDLKTKILQLYRIIIPSVRPQLFFLSEYWRYIEDFVIYGFENIKGVQAGPDHWIMIWCITLVWNGLEYYEARTYFHFSETWTYLWLQLVHSFFKKLCTRSHLKILFLWRQALFIVFFRIFRGGGYFCIILPNIFPYVTKSDDIVSF